VAVFAIAGTALAHTGPNQHLVFGEFDTGSATWQPRRNDSPLDTNRGRIKLAVAEQTGDDYVLAYANGTGIRGKVVENVRNLSFDFRHLNYVGAGAPRISVEVDTNDDGVADVYVYLSAAYCAEVLNGAWSRADFTGRTSAGCAFYTSEPVLPYESNGVEDAWTDFANAHAGARVLDAYVVMDEVGQSFIDRLAFQNHMFTRKPTPKGKGIEHCPTEGSC
jgi:hypothetical protein